MVVLYKLLLELLNEHKNRVLLFAQASLPEHQFKAFRKLYLNETGEKGLQKEIRLLIERQQGKERNGQE